MSELEFKPEDFKDYFRDDDVEADFNKAEHIAQIANAILQAKLAGAKKIYGWYNPEKTDSTWSEIDYGAETHTALLINIHPLNTKESKA